MSLARRGEVSKVLGIVLGERHDCIRGGGRFFSCCLSEDRRVDFEVAVHLINACCGGDLMPYNRPSAASDLKSCASATPAGTGSEALSKHVPAQRRAHFLSVFFLSFDPPCPFCPGNVPQSPIRGRALTSDMKSKHRAMAGPWAFFLTIALWEIRGHGVPGPLRQEPDIAYPPGEPVLPALSHTFRFISMGNMTSSPGAANRGRSRASPCSSADIDFKPPAPNL